MTTTECFAHTLKTLRKDKKLAQNELAKKLYVNRSLICVYEKGKRLPSIDMLIKISDFFEVSVDYLLGVKDKFCLNNTSYLDISGLNKSQIKILKDLIKEFNKQ